MPAGISRRWDDISRIYPLHAQGQQNHSRLLGVLPSSGQELIHQEGFTMITVSGDRVWIQSRGPLGLYLASLSPHFIVQEPRQRADTTGCSALAIAWAQACVTQSPPVIPEQHMENHKWWATSWGIIHNIQAPLFYPCEKSGLQDSTYRLPWEEPSEGSQFFFGHDIRLEELVRMSHALLSVNKAWSRE